MEGNRFQNMEEIKEKKSNDTAVGNSKESVAKVLWTMERLLEQGCGVQKELL